MSSKNLLDILSREDTHHIYLLLKKNLSEKLFSLSTVWRDINKEWRGGKSVSNQSSRVRLINARESHSTFSPGFASGFAPGLLASCFPPSSDAHLPLIWCLCYSPPTWALFSSQSTHSPWIFASSSTGLNHHAIYADVSPIFNSKLKLPPNPHTPLNSTA